MTSLVFLRILIWWYKLKPFSYPKLNLLICTRLRISFFILTLQFVKLHGSNHASSFLAVPSQMLDLMILVFSKSVGINELYTPFDLVIIVIKCFPLNVLIFASEDFMPSAQIDRSLFICYGLYKSLDLIVIVAMADCPPSRNHLNYLFNCSVPLIFELAVYRKSYLWLCHLERTNLWLFFFKDNHVTRAVFYSQDETSLTWCFLFIFLALIVD